LEKAQGVRRLGSAALDLCYVARGFFDGYWEIGLSPWDIAAGVLIVQEAGGIVTNFNGKTLDIWAGDVIAGNPIIHDAISRLV
jgi:myo-inositol-1(or 4)-monophosphatase